MASSTPSFEPPGGLTTNPSEPPPFLFLLCTFFPVAMFLSPATVLLPAFRKGSTSDLPPLPLTSQTLQCFIWGVFGAYKHSPVLIVPNTIGLGLGLWFLHLYKRVHNSEMYGADLRLQINWLGRVVVGVLVGVGVLQLQPWEGSAVPPAPGTATSTTRTAVLFFEAVAWLGCLVGTVLLTAPMLCGPREESCY